MSSIRPYVIRGKKQLACLAAAARQEIFDVLEQRGTVSVAELAAVLGRPADGLYFHLRALTRAGLVRQAGHRTRSGRKETLYRTVKPEVQLAYAITAMTGATAQRELGDSHDKGGRHENPLAEGDKALRQVREIKEIFALGNNKPPTPV